MTESSAAACLCRSKRHARPRRDCDLRREFLSEEELCAKLREHGMTDLSEVRAAFMESDGVISVIRRDSGQPVADAADEREHRR